MTKPRRPLDYYARKYGVPIKLAYAVQGTESGGRDDATSPKKAVGRLQIHLPSHPEVTEAQARDPDFNYDFGMKLLAGHKKRFGSWRLALAAYNAGAGAVEKYGGVPPYKETQNYVATILRNAGVLTPTKAAPGSVLAPTPTSSSGGAQDALSTPTVGRGLPDLGEASRLGLEDLRSGQYNPTKALGDLAATARRTVAGTEPPPEIAEGAFGGSEGFNPVELDHLAEDDDWQKWVIRPPAQQGPSAAHTDEILQFVGRIGRRHGQPLTPWPNESHSLTTVNGKPSAHGPGRAADIPARGAKLKRLGYLALLEAGMSKKEALKAARKGGLYNVGGYQIIFATDIGGDHHDHLHVGLRG